LSIGSRPAAALIATTALGGLYMFCWQPYLCNRVKRELIAPTQAAYESRGAPRAKMLARDNLQRIEKCRSFDFNDISVQMITAANLRVLGRNREAVDIYLQLLRIQKRPEIYMNLGQTEVDLGHQRLAVEAFFQAAIFNPWLIRDVEDGLSRQAVIARITARFPNDKALIDYVSGLASRTD
jgi:tetratricopeptide (TPR) repeat protein